MGNDQGIPPMAVRRIGEHWARRPQARRRRLRNRRPLGLEPLETRLALSADLIPLSAESLALASAAIEVAPADLAASPSDASLIQTASLVFSQPSDSFSVAESLSASESAITSSDT